jgi:CBS domain containing-hemolysin-like protein
MIHLKDLFKMKGEVGPGDRLMGIRREMLFVPETTSLERTLKLFLGRRVLMAIAVDEYGGTAGLVTLENVLEELVGEIRDEFDVEGAMVRREPDGSMVVEGGMALHEFASMFSVQADSKDVVTVSGYVIERLGHMPRPGTTVQLGEWKGTVGAVEAGRILTLRLRRTGTGDGSG